MVSPRIIFVIDLLIEVLLIAMLAFLPAMFGTVYARDEFIGFSGATALVVLLSIRGLLQPPTLTRAWIWIPPAIFVAIALIQLLPLPAPVVRVISPQTVQLKTELLSDLPNASDVLSRITLSFYTLATRHDLRVVLMAIAVLWAVTAVYRDLGRIRRLLWAITLIGGAIAALALAQNVTRTMSVYWVVEMDVRARGGPFFNYSHFAQFMNLSIGAAMALLLMQFSDDLQRDRRPLSHWIGIVVPGVVVIAGLASVLLSNSRGGMLSLAGAGLFSLITLMTVRHLRWLAGVVAMLGVFTVIVLCFYGIESVQQRLGQHGGADIRIQIIKDSWNIVRQFPVAGAGLGTFEWIYTMHDRTGTPSIASHAENEYVQVLTETGWIGLATVLAMVAIVGIHFVRALRSKDPRVAASAVGLGYGLVAVMIHSLTDFGQHLPANGCLSAALCGLIISLGSRDRDDSLIAPRRHMPVGGVIAAVACALMVWMSLDARAAWRAQAHWEMAQDIESRRNWQGTAPQYEQIIRHVQAAVDAQPDSAYYRYRAALYRWRQSRRTRDDGDPQLIPEAQQVVAALHEARRYAPTYGMIYSVVGQIEHAHLDMPVGINHIQTAARLEPNDPMIQYLAGRLEAQRGNIEAATQRFKQAVKLDGEMMTDVADAAIELKRPEIALAAGEVYYQRMLEAAAALEKVEEYKDLARQAKVRGVDMLEAKTETGNTSGFELSILANYRMGLEQYDGAAKAYERALEFDPTNLSWRLARAEALDRLGRRADAIEEAQRALRQHPDSPDAKRLLQYFSKPQ